jgi:hypothetical protein
MEAGRVSIVVGPVFLGPFTCGDVEVQQSKAARLAAGMKI